MDSAVLTQALMCPAAYPHPVDKVSLIETHISQVFLAGAFAYKLRKPVHLDFVDFSTLAARKVDCEAELALNRRMAAALYLGVVRIVAGPGQRDVRVDGTGEALEYAVKMRRFRQRDLLSAMAETNRLNGLHMETLARRLAAIHLAAPVAGDGTGHGTPARIAAVMEQVMAGVAALASGTAAAARVAALLRERAAALQPAFAKRLASGHVRECHGDLHLGNIAMIDGAPSPFDCLEFDAGLRWIDTISDAAFLFMDLLHAGRQDLAYCLINTYLECSGDYAGLAVLPFYTALRAVVRARVLLERAHQRSAAGTSTAEEMAATQVRCNDLLALASSVLTRRPGAIIIMHGLSGSGKSTVARQLAMAAAMVRVRSDVERKRLPRGSPALPHDRYSPGNTARVYRRLLAICRLGSGAGFPMIADATFLVREHRLWFASLAARRGVHFSIVDCNADVATLRERITARARRGGDPSDADLQVLEWQRRAQEPLASDEWGHVVRIADAEATA
ncbi:AAA family ATPase [Cupriavidus basilensis]|uniref:bifunctional aminoglycoside phosphotransferase/ATP-binding protein n=1 Tax=Cupriavidus basilensis TaxID=68895 RepID=UPI0023E881C7|nr:bifunctional aminoglycoside phosphotransferase/ATP-binding protein [Cupriavidus basilensis]MDF3888688.1 AAA family ATPase [Cupriavidus basilensis]